MDGTSIKMVRAWKFQNMSELFFILTDTHKKHMPLLGMLISLFPYFRRFGPNRTGKAFRRF
eukprot:1598106-Amphidinium_carterae.1